jgi:hypothetical protein
VLIPQLFGSSSVPVDRSLVTALDFSDKDSPVCLVRKLTSLQCPDVHAGHGIFQVKRYQAVELSRMKCLPPFNIFLNGLNGKLCPRKGSDTHQQQYFLNDWRGRTVLNHWIGFMFTRTKACLQLLNLSTYRDSLH